LIQGDRATEAAADGVAGVGSAFGIKFESAIALGEEGQEFSVVGSVCTADETIIDVHGDRAGEQGVGGVLLDETPGLGGRREKAGIVEQGREASVEDVAAVFEAIDCLNDFGPLTSERVKDVGRDLDNDLAR
jgi:hypothetical protein